MLRLLLAVPLPCAGTYRPVLLSPICKSLLAVVASAAAPTTTTSTTTCDECSTRILCVLDCRNHHIISGKASSLELVTGRSDKLQICLDKLCCVAEGWRGHSGERG